MGSTCKSKKGFSIKTLIALLLFIPLMLTASEPLPFNLKYPTAKEASKLKEQNYDKLNIYIKGEGNRALYGHTWKQKYKFPKFKDSNQKEVIKSFFAKSLNLKSSEFKKGDYAHFYADDKEYWFKYTIYAQSYTYTLLHVQKYKQSVSFDNDISYVLDKKFIRRHGKVKIPKNIAIAHIKDYAIERYAYHKYDEQTFRYNKKATVHKGQFWKIDFNNIGKDKNYHRYSMAHDYTAKILQLGATILKDEDNGMLFRLDYDKAVNYIKINSYNRTFSVSILQEKPFKQSLILTPDAIKEELDKTGKITLEGIFFDFNKATLKPKSKKAILSAVALMEQYKDLILTVNGYTDNKGSDNYNNKLSKERAASVAEGIIAEGIESSRLKSNGYGEENPIATNDTEEGRSKNRRVELHKVSGGNKKSIITIDFIKPLENSVIASKYAYKERELSIHHTKPYSKNKKLVNYKGHLDTINYRILKDGKVDKSISRKEIIKNYENVLELYSAKIIGKYINTLYFKIADRGDKVTVYGRVDAYDGKYNINFLIEEK